MTTTVGYAAMSKDGVLKPFVFKRRELRPNDVGFDVLYCGVCHTDLHEARGDWGRNVYPVVPGHEIVGRVVKVGSAVTKVKKGDAVAVGYLSDSCMNCHRCHSGEEQLCRHGAVCTFGAKDLISGEPTCGGFSKYTVVREDFIVKVPDGLDLARAGPLLCAGITVYSPLRTWHVGPGMHVGVAGLGGLGHLGVKLASAMGARVTVISRTEDKRAESMKLGADEFLLSTNAEAMKKAAGSMQVILDTIPVKHDINEYIPLLDADGTLVIVGQLGPLKGELNTAPIVLQRRKVAGSVIGGIRQTQELLDFCARKNVLPECETIRMDQINDAFKRMEKSDVRYRFVVDMSTLHK